ncbi:MAG: ATP-binding cassette domain-containing protein [Oscillospiraceae bacterium]|nr:ATP-binding cassette domain-containing protein [Oscillospiraceae bacterium]
MAIIRTKDLTKTYHTRIKAEGLKAGFSSLLKPEYKDVTAVNGIDLEIEKGEIIAFIGPNGAGKSTFIKMLCGILYPTSGEISVLGMSPIEKRRSLTMKIGTVFGQKSQLWFHLPALDSFTLLAAIYEISDAERTRRVGELSERLDLTEFLTTPVRRLSLGQRIRCEIAASLLHEPQLLFLDEPTIGLDIVGKQAVREVILESNRDRGTTVFLTSHDPMDVEHLAQRTVVIDNGKIVVDASLEQLKREYIKERVIEISFVTPQRLPQLDNVKVTVEEGGLKVRLMVQDNLEEILRNLSTLEGIADITISHPPMEEIIASIFRKQGEVG